MLSETHDHSRVKDQFQKMGLRFEFFTTKYVFNGRNKGLYNFHETWFMKMRSKLRINL